MKSTLYLQMLLLINMHRTWIVADNGYVYDQCIIIKRNRQFLYVCRILRLHSLYPHGKYRSGMVWNIPEYELDRALAWYRKTNHDARRRLAQDVSFLETKDVEAIIEKATYGLIRLELTDMPLFRH